MNKKGAALLIAIVVVLIASIIVLSIMPQAVNHRQITQASADSIRALYAAESGINRAVKDLNSQDFTAWTINGNIRTLPPQPLVDNSGATIGFYEVELDMTDTENPDAEATGYSPTLAGSERSLMADIGRVDAAIVAKGDVDEGGNALITGPDPDEDYVEEFVMFSFQNIFGDTIANVKADPETQLINDPPNNYAPVADWQEAYTDDSGNGLYDLGEPFVDVNGNGVCDEYKITWFDIPDGKKAKISATDWRGAALDDVTGILNDGTILVVEGNIEITGGDFYGVLYICGNLTFAAGNSHIYGTIFVDGDVEDITEVKGTTVITYDPDKVIEAFGYNPLPFGRKSWREIYK
ncbi:MAG: pilus assembly PilX N-terminal domain-containing protein [Candidatus Omnitrophota bacterium]